LLAFLNVILIVAEMKSVKKCHKKHRSVCWFFC